MCCCWPVQSIEETRKAVPDIIKADNVEALSSKCQGVDAGGGAAGDFG